MLHSIRPIQVFLAAMGIVGMLAAAAEAQSIDPAKMFQFLDRNQDGKLAKTEVPEAAWQQVAGADADGDEAITLQELAQWAQGARGGSLPMGNSRKAKPKKGPDLAQLFQRLDRNRDQKITPNEIPPKIAPPIRDLLVRADADGNRMVTKPEFEAAWKAMQQAKGARDTDFEVDKVLARFDKNGDEKLSKEEMPMQVWLFLASGDADGDGALDRAELAALQEKMSEAAGGENRPVADPLFKRYDKNGDGAITPDELPPEKQKIFPHIDTDGDGEVTPEEFDVARKRRRKQG